MDRTRPLLPIVRHLIFPVACIACAIWITAFAVIFERLPQRNLGSGLLVIVLGVILMIPWMAMVVGMLRRMQGRETSPPAVDDPSAE